MDDDKVMICFFYHMNKEDTEPRRICQFRTTRFAEWLKMLNYCKHHFIDFWPHDMDEKFDKDAEERIDGVGCYVEDVSVRFGSDDVIQCIDVLLK